MTLKIDVFVSSFFSDLLNSHKYSFNFFMNIKEKLFGERK